MAEIVSPIVLIGPTTVGKSEIAKGLADAVDGDIINADRLYNYACDELILGLGLQKGELDDGRSRHLYGCLRPYAKPFAPEEYLDRVAKTVTKVHDAGKVAVIEGCTRKYNDRLLAYYGVSHAVAITWPNRNGLPDFAKKRIGQLVSMGLYEETKYADSLGYASTFPMSSIMYSQALQVIKGESSKAEAENRMISQCLDTAFAHDDFYKTIASLPRLAHNRSETAQAVTEVLDHFIHL